MKRFPLPAAAIAAGVILLVLALAVSLYVLLDRPASPRLPGPQTASCSGPAEVRAPSVLPPETHNPGAFDREPEAPAANPSPSADSPEKAPENAKMESPPPTADDRDPPPSEAQGDETPQPGDQETGEDQPAPEDAQPIWFTALLRGTVITCEGEIASNASVYLTVFRMRGDEIVKKNPFGKLKAATDASGSFLINLEGEVLEGETVACSVYAWVRGIPESESLEFELANCETRSDLELRLGGYGSIVGRLFDDTGAPATDVLLDIKYVNRKMTSTAGVEADGSFKFPFMTSGKVVLRASVCGLALSVETEISPGQETDLGDLHMKRVAAVRFMPREVHGEIYFVSPQVMWMCVIDLTDADGNKQTLPLLRDKDGSLYANELPAGSWKAVLHVLKESSQPIDIEVRENETTELGDVDFPGLRNPPSDSSGGGRPSRGGAALR